MPSFPGRKSFQIFKTCRHVFIDRRILHVGADHVLRLPPKMIHGVEFRRTLRQPKELNVEVASQSLRTGCCMARILIQQHGHVPTTIMLVDQVQKRLKVLLLLMLTSQKQPCSGAEIHGPEDHSASIPAREQNAVRFSPSAPVGTQRRKQQQIGLVLDQQDTPRRQMADFPANSTFFSRAPGPEPRHTALASIRTPAVAARAVRCDRKTCGRWTSPTGPAAREPSSSQHSNPVRWENDRGRLATIRSILRSSDEDGLGDHRRAETRDPMIRDKHESIGERCADSRAAFERFLRWIALDRTPEPPASAGTVERRGSSSIAARADADASRSIASASDTSLCDCGCDSTRTSRCDITFGYLLSRR